MNYSSHSNRSYRLSRKCGFPRVGSVIAVVATSSLLVACGSDSSDTVGVQTLPSVTVGDTSAPTTSETPSTDAPQTGEDLYAEFSQCMRDNGYPNFEDLTGDAFSAVTSSEDGAKVFQDEMARRGIDLADPSSGPAMDECGPILEQMAASAPVLSDTDKEQQETLLLNFAQCMRDSGQTDWPDPDFAANGPSGYSVETMQSIDFNDPEVVAAGQNCDPDRKVLAIFGK